MPAIWLQNYNPAGNVFISTSLAAVPIVALLGSIAFLKIRIHLSALLGLAIALLLALVVYGMPWKSAGAAAAYGAAFGLFPIGWIILNVLFLYQLTVRRGLFEILRQSLAQIAPDARIQVILIAFSFGAFIEGVAGFGTPVAITGAILIQLGFNPLHACGLALIANTAPVAFGSLGIPITTLEQVSGLDAHQLSAMVGRQLPFFSLIIPFWVVGAYDGLRGIRAVWPAALTAGLAFAVPQFLISNFHGPWLVDTISAACSIAALVLLLRVWKPSSRSSRREEAHSLPSGNQGQSLLTSAASAATPEKAEFNLNLLSATGSGILFAAIVAGFTMGYAPAQMGRIWLETVWRVRFSLLTIAAMLALGNVTKFSGADATLGLALAHTGRLYPFFGTLLGWLGVALTGSDTASNVLFGSLQKITAQQQGISPILMGAANSSGGVMGKMIDAQSIVVASTATNWYGHEGSVLRFVFLHSLILAVLVGILVFLQAYVFPFTLMVVH